MTPNVSFMVPVFNRANLLADCLDSALAQTATDLEVVVVDGASTDNTWEVCEQYAAKDVRVRIFREARNSGPGPGWERCLREARGRYATFLWSDDLVAPDFVERSLAAMDDDVAFVYSAAEIGSSPGRGRVAYLRKSKAFPSELFIRGALVGSDFPVSPACGLFRLGDLRASFMMELPTSPPVDLRRTGAGTDVLLYLLTALRYPNVRAIGEPLAFFRSHRGSITVQGHSGEVARSYAATKAWFAAEFGYSNLIGRVVAHYWLQHAKSLHLLRPTAASRQCGSDASATQIWLGVLRDLGSILAQRVNRVSRELARTRRWA